MWNELFLLPFLTGLALAIVLPLLGAYLRLRDEWLAAGLQRLSSEHRMALELTYFVGLSCEEVAEVVGCPVGTVKTRVFYARQQLRALLVELAAPHSSQQGEGSL